MILVRTVLFSWTCKRSNTNTLTEGICRGVQLHEFWAVPFELGIALWLLQRQLELSFLAPAAVAIISTAGTEWVSKYVGPAQVVWNEGIQTRVDVSASMLGSMKVRSITQKEICSADGKPYLDRPSKCLVSPRESQASYKGCV